MTKRHYGQAVGPIQGGYKADFLKICVILCDSLHPLLTVRSKRIIEPCLRCKGIPQCADGDDSLVCAVSR